MIQYKKHLGIHLNAKSNFQKHLDNIISKVDKTIKLLRNPRAVLPRLSVVTVSEVLVGFQL